MFRSAGVIILPVATVGSAFMPRIVPLVDTFMRNDGRSARAAEFTRDMLAEFNVNLHAAADDCDDFLDGDDDPLEGLTIIEEEEFFERYVL